MMDGLSEWEIAVVRADQTSSPEFPEAVPAPSASAEGEKQLGPGEEARLRRLAHSRRIGTAFELLARSLVIGALFAFAQNIVNAAFYFQEHRHHLWMAIVIWLPVAIVASQALLGAAQLIYFSTTVWPKRYAEAQTIENESLLRGFTDLFRLYARTRKIGIYSYFWVIFSLYFTVIVFLKARQSDLLNPVVAIAILAMLTSGAINALVGYQFSKGFLIGKILVDHILVMNERANQAQVPPDVARERTKLLATWYRKNRYWWFY